MSSTWLDVITDAMVEIGAYGLSDALPPEQVQFAIRKLNRIVDQWAARKCYAYTTTFSQFTLTPNHQPHLMGPAVSAPDFTISTTRPVRIESAALILTGQTPNVDAPLNIRDSKWWANERVKGITSNVPTDLYYEADFPAGSLYFWPVPSYAYGVRLETWTVQTSVPLNESGNPDPTQTFSGPEGYENAILLTLAEELCTPFGRQVPPELRERAAKARATVQANNLNSPRIESADWGMRGSKCSSDFNWTTGLPS